MISLRNGTAAAIILSIAFVVVAVAGRDMLPGSAGNNGRTATSVANELVETGPAVDTGGSAQIGQPENLANSTTDLPQSFAWDEEDDDHAGSNDGNDDDHHDDEHNDEHDDHGDD